MSPSPAVSAGPLADLFVRAASQLEARAVRRGGEPEFELVVEPDENGPARARPVIRERLARWEVTAAGDDLVLAAHELITNAARHGCSCPGDVVIVVMSRVGGHVLVAVHDPSPLPPTVREPFDDEESGRGLPLVGALCDRWGVLPAPDGKWVWLIRAIGYTGLSRREEVDAA